MITVTSSPNGRRFESSGTSEEIFDDLIVAVDSFVTYYVRPEESDRFLNKIPELVKKYQQGRTVTVYQKIGGEKE